MQWNLEQIRLFVSVAERQSFSAAARELKRVQSAVSNGIALLEADLGVTLFERSSGLWGGGSFGAGEWVASDGWRPDVARV